MKGTLAFIHVLPFIQVICIISDRVHLLFSVVRPFSCGFYTPHRCDTLQQASSEGDFDSRDELNLFNSCLERGSNLGPVKVAIITKPPLYLDAISPQVLLNLKFTLVYETFIYYDSKKYDEMKTLTLLFFLLFFESSAKLSLRTKLISSI